MKTFKVKAFGTHAADKDLELMEINRRQLLADDVEIDILYCGVCHSDLHTARNDWKGTVYPTVPGHEIVGKITAVGSNVTKFKIGDLAGVGCIVDGCAHCKEEQYHIDGFTSTYNSPDIHLGGTTLGGYTEKVIVKENFVIKIPNNLDLSAVAPLLCAGITTWSPLRHWNVKKGDNVAVIGLGGLGHMAIKLAIGLGANVTLFSRSANKIEDAKELGASNVIISTDELEMKSVANTFDLIIDTIPYNHDVNPYINTLKTNGTIVLVGYLGELSPTLNTAPLVMGRKSVAGSVIGGIAETQEMLDFCGEHNIVADVEMIAMQDINTAYERMIKSDVKYRFVIDMSSLKKEL